MSFIFLFIYLSLHFLFYCDIFQQYSYFTSFPTFFFHLSTLFSPSMFFFFYPFHYCTFFFSHYILFNHVFCPSNHLFSIYITLFCFQLLFYFLKSNRNFVQFIKVNHLLEDRKLFVLSF